MLSITEDLVKHDLFQYFGLWFNNSTLPTYKLGEKYQFGKFLLNLLGRTTFA